MFSHVEGFPSQSLTYRCLLEKDQISLFGLCNLDGPFPSSDRTRTPGITLLAKDLGVDSNAGRRRRLATFLGRQGKAKSRSRRMRNLRIPRPKARIRLARGSVLTSATYGHQSQGISPKRMKWLRATLVSNLGRQTLGGTLTVLEIHSHQIPDPLEQTVCEHVQVFSSYPEPFPSHLGGSPICLAHDPS